MRFMLDTDTVSFALRGQGAVASRMVSHRASELCISAVTLAELRYGANRRKSSRLHRMIDSFAARVAVMPFDEDCAAHYGLIANALAARGALIGDCDVLIAAHALTLELTLVTNNTKHFSRVKGLTLENWV